MDTITHHTLRAVLSRKLATAIESWSLGEIIRTVLLLLLSGLLSAAFFDTAATRALVHAVVEWHDFALCRTAIIFGFVFQFHRLRAAYGHLAGIVKATGPAFSDKIEDFPKDKLVEYLDSVRTFKRDEVLAAFHPIPQYRVERLTKKLKELDVLHTGENRMSVLNPAWTADDLTQLFDGKTEASQLTALFRRDGRGLTSRPSGEDSPTPPVPSPFPFTIKPLAAASHETVRATDAPRTVRSLRAAYATAGAAA